MPPRCHITLPVLCAVALAVALPVGASTTVVDWLTPSPTDLSHLLDDNGDLTATISVNIIDGNLPGGYPASTVVSHSFWLPASPEFADSLSGTSSVAALDFLVLPVFSSSLVQYRITIEGALSDSVLMIGQLSALGSARIEITHDGGSPLSFTGQYSWDQGLQPFNGAVTWDPGSGLLAADPANASESGYAFFHASNPNRYDLTFTSSASSPLGDRIVIGIGVIPEPASVSLLLLATPFLLRRRRHR